MALSTEQGFPFWLALGAILRGWALAEQGQVEEGIAQMQPGLGCLAGHRSRAGAAVLSCPAGRGVWKSGQTEEGLTVLAEALAVVDKTGERVYEAELYRLYGELSLRRANRRVGEQAKSPSAPSPSLPVAQSSPERSVFSQSHRDCPQAAGEVAGAASGDELGRLWQQQGKKNEAHQMLSEIYNWFTEGFDTKDLQEAKALLEELS